MKIAGVVVLYNPDYEIIENIKTYLPFLDCLYLLDNSTSKTSIIKLLTLIDKVKYISLNGNKGIAKALKVATETAIKDGYKYLLTMDQDSKFPTKDFEYIKNYIKNNDISNVGLISINYSGSKLKVISEDKSYVEKTNLCITSGTFMVLDNYKKIDGFNEDLFIEMVDYDICCQFYEKDIDMILFRNIMLNHRIGEEQVLNFLLFKIKRVIHNGVRYYYKYRNWHYLKKTKSKKYLENMLTIKKRFGIARMIRRILFQKDKIINAKLILKGIKDGKKGILGPYSS